jgi:hypothetical protein
MRMAEDANVNDEMENIEDTGGGLPYQLDVYFKEFPNFDIEKLAKDINDSEPEEKDVCEIEAMQEKEGGSGIKIGGLAATLGDLSMAVLIHGAPSPAADIIEISRIRDDVKKELIGHKAFALLNVLGGENYLPVEKTLFMYKMAMAMCKQGAIGTGNIHTHKVLPGDLLLDLMEHTPEEGEPSLWESLRRYGDPMELLADIITIKLQDKIHMATCGFGYCGLPDLVFEVVDKNEIDEIAELFGNVFHYMMENGPVIKAGHTMGPDESVTFSFQELPAGLELPYPTKEVLLVTKGGKKKKKKKRFGLF